MTERVHQPSPALSFELIAILRWTARVGAVTAEALAHLQGTSVRSARARLSAAARKRLLARHRLLVDRPALYTVTHAGIRVAGLSGLGPGRVSAANSLHTAACANVAAALQRCYPEQRIFGERELRREERRRNACLASATLRYANGDRPFLHRPDLVLQPLSSDRAAPIAVEVELTIKAPRRLEQICRAWARSRNVSGVLYLAPPDVERALHRAIAKAHAEERIVVVPLAALPLAGIAPPIHRCIPSSP